MAAAPVFAATPKAWAVISPATLDTSLTAPTNTATLVTAGSSGSKVEQIRINYVATISAACVLNIFLHDGSTYHLFDTLTVPVTTTVSTASAGVTTDKYYTNLVIQSGWSIRCTVTTSAGQSAFKVVAFGGDF